MLRCLRLRVGDGLLKCGRGLGGMSGLFNGAPTRAARAVFSDIGRKTATNLILGAQPASNYVVLDSFFEHLANYRKKLSLTRQYFGFSRQIGI